MPQQETAPAAADQKPESSRRIRPSWPDSLLFSLAVAVLVGGLDALLLMGPAPLNPRNIDWLTPDPATYHIGWELFRQDPHLHWPLTFTDRLGYPQGESIALMDPNPLLALILKPLSPILPEPFQYLGIEVILVLVLQTFFGLRLFRLLCGPRTVPILAGAAFVLLSPPLTYRLVGHYALSNHWLILAGLLIFFLPQKDPACSVKRFWAYSVVLASISLAINPYIAFQVLLILAAGAATLYWQGRVRLPAAIGGIAAVGVASLITCLALGLFISGGRGYAAGGYRFYSMNLLAAIDPYGYGSLFLPKLPQLTGGQYEGYNYLGAGFLLVAVFTLPLFIMRRERLQVRHQVLVPLLGVCAVLMLMALSTKISAGNLVLVDLDPHEMLTKFLAPFRASGRLFWAPYYAIMIGVLVGAYSVLNRKTANILLLIGLAVQVADTAPLRKWTHSQVNQEHPQPLRSKVWTNLGSQFRNLMVVPPWQCGGDTPGGGPGYRIFGLLAAEQRMRTNGYYSARYTETAKDYQCGTLETEVVRGSLSPDSVYVVSPVLAAMIAESPAGPNRCHDVDGFVLCSVRSDFGLGPAVTNPIERLKLAFQNADFEAGEISAWAPFLDVRAATTSDRAHSGSHSLAESGSHGSVYQDVTGLEKGHEYAVSAWVAFTQDATATGQIALYDPDRDLATFSALVNPGASWRLVTQSFQAGASGTIRVHLFRNEGAGVVYWDDVQILRLK
jgi:hypothetical protein